MFLGKYMGMAAVTATMVVALSGCDIGGTSGDSSVENAFRGQVGTIRGEYSTEEFQDDNVRRVIARLCSNGRLVSFRTNNDASGNTIFTARCEYGFLRGRNNIYGHVIKGRDGTAKTILVDAVDIFNPSM